MTGREAKIVAEIVNASHMILCDCYDSGDSKLLTEADCLRISAAEKALGWKILDKYDISGPVGTVDEAYAAMRRYLGKE